MTSLEYHPGGFFQKTGFAVTAQFGGLSATWQAGPGQLAGPEIAC